VFNAQAVEIATNVSGEFMNLHSDGLVGLGFTNGNTVTPDEQKTFLDNIAPQLEKPLMAVVLNHDGAGHFDFGFLDEKYYQGKIWYADVDESTSFWTFNGTGYAIEGEKFHSQYFSPALARSFNNKKLFLATTLSFIMDTGTSIILLTDDITIPYYQKVHGAVNSTQGYVFPCDAKLPSITIRIGTGGHFTVPSEYLNFGPVSSASTTVLNGDLTKESGHGRPGNNGTQELCYGAIQSSQDQGEDGLNILGDAFIKAFFVVFGMNGPQIGVAHRKKLS
jgi:aspergillopepsin I